MYGKGNSRLKLLPSLKEKPRYLVLISELTEVKKLKEEIEKTLLAFLGELGWAKAGPMLVESGKVNSRKAYCILRIDRAYVNQTKACLALMKKRVNCIGVSGTIKKARKKFLTSLISQSS